MTTSLLIAAIDLETRWWESALRLLLAAALGGAVGWDREAKNRAAGLRTFMLVALGSAAFTLVAQELMAAMRSGAAPEGIDPMRIMGSIVGGIGFLGAGAIIQSGRNVHGLTTAAGLWAIATAGMAIGIGAYLLGLLVTILAFLTLSLFALVEQKVKRNAS